MALHVKCFSLARHFKNPFYRSVRHTILFGLAFVLTLAASHAAPEDYFAIEVVDDATGRGVPLVELTTVNSVSYWTDSNGLIAFHEPGLMGQEVFFHVRGDGYEYPKDFFGNRGMKLRPTPGGKATIKLKRLNIAERLYRITGEGIYRDTVLLGRRPPTKQPLLNGQVMGQDTVIATPYRGKIYWFWGDTDRASYPLGNFGASGATSELPAHGGIDPSVGVDLTYFVDMNGFSKPMCPDASFGEGLKWIEGLTTLRDETGRERLLARVAAGTGMEKTRDWRVGVFDDEKGVFESVARWDIHEKHDSAHPFRAFVGSIEYIYLYPDYRVRAEFKSVTNRAAYEAFTCLADSKPNRSADGMLTYEWRAGAGRLNGARLRELVKAGSLKAEESWWQFRDIETDRPVDMGRGSVCWNEYRQRWVMIASGQAGEIWFAEADTPVGPWVYARRIVAHDHYNFYNPTQHSFFDQEDGRLIYFEGTYTASFSGAKAKTPRYDYNQIMYRLALDDPRLALPVPVYSVRDGGLMLKPQVEAAKAWQRIQSVAFLALTPAARSGNCVAIYKSGTALSRSGDQPLFFGLAPVQNGTVPLYQDGQLGAGLGEPLCYIWRYPMSLIVIEGDVKPNR